MSIFSNGIVCALALGLVTSCVSETDHGPKPESDPDVGLIDGKDDALSNRFTTIVGSIVPTDKASSHIDWPDWFHGYTVTLEAGVTMEIEVDASAAGPFRVYGPSHRTRRNGRPMFRRAMASTFTTLYAGRHGAKFELEIEETGTYLVVYGPAYEWSADYTIGVRCAGAAECPLPGQCFGDDECSAGNYCGDNGVRCITFPCDANYNVCKPTEADGQWCDRDAACTTGTCSSNSCGVAATCESDDDCADSFCGWADDNSTRVCKAYSQEGETCGGFVVPSARRLCEPGLVCPCSEPTCDAPGTCQQPE